MTVVAMGPAGELIEPSVLALLGLLVVGVLTAFGVILGIVSKRVTDLEAEQRDLESYNDELWVYARSLIDLYYRFRRPDAPDPDKPPTRRGR